jgi:hypothetical protein
LGTEATLVLEQPANKQNPNTATNQFGLEITVKGTWRPFHNMGQIFISGRLLFML